MSETPDKRIRELARKIVNLNVGPEIQSRIDYLADKANEGLLTSEEEVEYKTIVEGIDIISTLQLKARRFLDDDTEASL